MSVGLAVRDLRCDAVVVGGDPGVIERIVQPDVHLAIWQRGGPDVADGVDLGAVGGIDMTVAVDAIGTAVCRALADAGYRDAAALGAEVVALGTRFAGFMGCRDLRIRLDVIETDACRKFHADQVTARLLMPLIGPGTEWMYADTMPQRPDGRLRTGDVALFKGRIWAPEPAILHRSPPIAGTGIHRLLLVIDAAAGARTAYR